MSDFTGIPLDEAIALAIESIPPGRHGPVCVATVNAGGSSAIPVNPVTGLREAVS